MHAPQSSDQFLLKMATSVRKNDLQGFTFHVQMGVARLGEEKIATDMNERLPLILDVQYIPTLLKFLAGEAYFDTVNSFLAEMIKLLSTMGFSFGVDFSYRQKEDGTPCLHMTKDIADKVMDIYMPHAWKQCAPYLVFR